MKAASAPPGVLDVSKYVGGVYGGRSGINIIRVDYGEGAEVAMSREKLEEESGLETAKIVLVVFLLISRVFALAFLGIAV